MPKLEEHLDRRLRLAHLLQELQLSQRLRELLHSCEHQPSLAILSVRESGRLRDYVHLGAVYGQASAAKPAAHLQACIPALFLLKVDQRKAQELRILGVLCQSFELLEGLRVQLLMSDAD